VSFLEDSKKVSLEAATLERKRNSSFAERNGPENRRPISFIQDGMVADTVLKSWIRISDFIRDENWDGKNFIR
jgi:hypothetical protein